GQQHQHVRDHRRRRRPRRLARRMGLGPPHRWTPGRGQREEGRRRRRRRRPRSGCRERHRGLLLRPGIAGPLMRKRFPSSSLSSYGSGRSTNQRIAIGATVVAVLLALAGVVALLTGGGNSQQTPDAAPPAPTGGPSHSEAAPKPSSGSGSVPKPPQIAEPVAYAKAAAQMLWSYDTRDTSRDQQLAGMRAWMTTETKYADWTSVAGQVPDP